jgi:peptide/nickel transport system substrate-binding protein
MEGSRYRGPAVSTHPEEPMIAPSRWPRLTLRLGVVLCATILTLAESSPPPAPVQAAAKGAKPGAAAHCKTVTPKGTVKFSDWQFPANLNPFTISSLVEAYVTNAMEDGFWVYNDKARFVPQLAARVPSTKNGDIRDGARTVVVHLKHGNRWSDGSEITSADVKFGFEVGSTKVSGPVCSGSCDIISRIDTPDRYTAVLHLKRPYVPVLAYGMPPLVPHRWKSAAGSWSTPQAAAQLIYGTASYTFETAAYPTSGPYQVSQFVKGDRVVFKPMKYYRDMSCGSRLQSLIFAFYSDKAALIAAAGSGDTDVTGGGGGYTLADMTALRQHIGTYRLNTFSSFSQEHAEFNLDPQYKGKPNPLANVKVRQALALALDKAGLIRSALAVSATTERSVVAWSPWVNTPQLVQPFADRSIRGQWDPLTKTYVASTGSGKALQDAKTLLAQTPYKDGFTLDLYTSAGNSLRAAEAGIMQSNWKRLGVNVTIYYSPPDKFFSDWATGSELNHGAFQVAVFGFTGSPDPDQIKYDLVSTYIDREKQDHSSPLNINFAGIRDHGIDVAFKQGAIATSSKARATAYDYVQQRLNQQAYWVPLYFRPSIITYNPRVRGVVNNPTQAGPTGNVYDWQLTS